MFLLFVALALFVAGTVLLWLGRRQRVAAGLPAGEVVYSDTGDWRAVEKPLVSRRYGLVGRPDYLVVVSAGRRQFTVPVEVKSRHRPPQPYASHILQLAAYCLLVEDVMKERPPFGLLHYADATLRIPFTDELRRHVLAMAEEIRRGRSATYMARSHQDPGRCSSCGYRGACGEEALG
jgi:CRISPR-associated exonuclease Cas4